MLTPASKIEKTRLSQRFRARRLLFSAHDLETAFSCQTTSLEISNSLPSLLRNVALEIEKHV
jgi:hypothetical protein